MIELLLVQNGQAEVVLSYAHAGLLGPRVRMWAAHFALDALHTDSLEAGLSARATPRRSMGAAQLLHKLVLLALNNTW